MRASSSKNLAALENSIGYAFKKKSLLKEAVTHKSYAHEKQNKSAAFNERMEFLGDAVLDLVIANGARLLRRAAAVPSSSPPFPNPGSEKGLFIRRS